jgi:hypothetical protein
MTSTLSPTSTSDDARRASSAEPLVAACARLDAAALGIATGAVAGVALFLATVRLILAGGAVVGPNLSLLAQYFPGFSVTWPGAVVGLLYGCAAGFAAGWTFAAVRNRALRSALRRARARATRAAERRFLDYV